MHTLAFRFSLSQFLELAVGKLSHRKILPTNLTRHVALHLVLHATSQTREHVKHGMVPQVALVQSVVVIQRFAVVNEAL